MVYNARTMSKKFTIKKNKDVFDNLTTEFKDAVAQSSPTEIKQRVASLVLEHAALMEAQKEDQHYQEAKSAFATASKVYSDSKKATKIKLAYCRQVLEDKGNDPTAIENPTVDSLVAAVKANPYNPYKS